MTRISTIIAVAFLTLAVGMEAGAQGAGPAGGAPAVQGQHGKQGREGQRGHMIQRFIDVQEKVFAKLDLKEKQKKEIKALQNKTKEALENLRKDMKDGGDRSAAREKAQDIRKEYHESLMKILTPEQQKQYKEEMKKLMQEMRKKGVGPGGPGGRREAGGAGR